MFEGKFTINKIRTKASNIRKAKIGDCFHIKAQETYKTAQFLVDARKEKRTREMFAYHINYFSFSNFDTRSTFTLDQIYKTNSSNDTTGVNHFRNLFVTDSYGI